MKVKDHKTEQAVIAKRTVLIHIYKLENKLFVKLKKIKLGKTLPK